jgi:hypothetical protein
MRHHRHQHHNVKQMLTLYHQQNLDQMYQSLGLYKHTYHHHQNHLNQMTLPRLLKSKIYQTHHQLLLSIL